MDIMELRERIIGEIVEEELLYVKVEHNGSLKPMYEVEGFDKEKFEAEGSEWIVYVLDCMSMYYQKYKERIEDRVDEILREALESRGK